MYSDIHAINTFDPSNHCYLEVVEVNGFETLQANHKNFFQRFVMWLGRVFSCCSNQSTSMKKIADYVARNIEALCKDEELSPQRFSELFDKMRRYAADHSEANLDLTRIQEVAVRTITEYPLQGPGFNHVETFESFEKFLHDGRNPVGDYLDSSGFLQKQKLLIRQLTVDDLKRFLVSRGFATSQTCQILCNETHPAFLVNTVVVAIRDLIVELKGANEDNQYDDLLVSIEEFLIGIIKENKEKINKYFQDTAVNIKVFEELSVERRNCGDFHTLNKILDAYVFYYKTDGAYDANNLADMSNRLWRINHLQKSTIEECLIRLPLDESNENKKFFVLWITMGVPFENWGKYGFITEKLNDFPATLRLYKEAVDENVKSSIRVQVLRDLSAAGIR